MRADDRWSPLRCLYEDGRWRIVLRSNKANTPIVSGISFVFRAVVGASPYRMLFIPSTRRLYGETSSFSCHPERKNAKRFGVEVLRRRSKTEERSDDGVYKGSAEDVSRPQRLRRCPPMGRVRLRKTSTGYFSPLRVTQRNGRWRIALNRLSSPVRSKTNSNSNSNNTSNERT